MAPIQNSSEVPVDGIWPWCVARASLAASPLRRRDALATARAAAKLEARFQAADDDELRERRIELASIFRSVGLERSAVGGR
jgi:hypothetical protein